MLKKVSGALLGSLVSISSLAIPTQQPPGLNIPRQEIQQFVTSIAVIKHYYIKDVPDKKIVFLCHQRHALELRPALSLSG